MAEEILTWIIVGVYIAGVIKKIFSDRKRSKKRSMTVVSRPSRPDAPMPSVSAPALSSAVDVTTPADVRTETSAAQPGFTFNSDTEGVRSTGGTTDENIREMPRRRLSPRRRALRRTIILGEMLAPRFDTINKF